MTKRQSVITPPPVMEMGAGSGDGEDGVLTEDEKKDALIKLVRRGAPSVPIPEKEAEAGDEDPRTKITIRLKKSLVERFEIAARARPLKTPVNTWITEAILDKLKREGG